MVLDYIECTSNLPRIILADSSVLAPESSSNVVGAQQEYLEHCWNAVGRLRMYFKCSRVQLDCYTNIQVPRLLERNSNTVQIYLEYSRKAPGMSKNLNGMQLEYLESTRRLLEWSMIGYKMLSRLAFPSVSD